LTGLTTLQGGSWNNRRLTGYFGSVSPTTTSVTVPLSAPTTSLPLDFRPSATDADNHGVATVAAVYAQDQVVLSPRLQATLGLRYDRFRVAFRNNRTAADLSSQDGLVSPAAGPAGQADGPALPSTPATASRICRGPASSCRPCR